MDSPRALIIRDQRSEDETPSQLNVSRLIEIASACGYPETRIVRIKVHICQREPTSIERVDKIDTNFKSSRFGNTCLFEDVEVFGVERLRAQI